MTTIVFLHGGGMGGWVWDGIAPVLRSEGHTVSTPTFTGFGERSHLIGRDVTHDVHVSDIVNHLAYEDLRNVTLVAYSYGGSVAPGVCACSGERIDRVIYLDGIVPEAGRSVSEAMGYMTAVEASDLDGLLASGEGPIGTGVDRMQREATAKKPYLMSSDRQEWLLGRMSDMPMRGMVSAVSTGAETIDRRVDYLGITGDVMEPQHDRARRLGWNVETMGPEVDHAFIVGAPERVLAYLRSKL